MGTTRLRGVMEHITLIMRRLRHSGGNHRDGFVQLFISKRLIHGLAAAMALLFVPIFLYVTGGHRFWPVGVFYGVVSLLYVLLLVPAMHITNLIGFSRALGVGMVFAIIQYLILYFTNATNFFMVLPLLIAALTLFRLFHWVPFHVDFTEFTQGGSRGKDVSLTLATVAFMGMLGPVLAGFIIEEADYGTMFLANAVLMCIAAFSYLFVPAVQEKFTWTYQHTLRRLCSKEFRPILIGEFASGAETVVNLVAWPIFLFIILEGDTLEIGGVSTLIVGATILLQLFVGKRIDAKFGSSARILKRGSVFYALGWLFKIFVISATQVFLVGMYHSITKIFTKTPYNSLLYDMSGEQGHYVDEFTVMKEMANHAGRVLAIVVMVVLTFSVPFAWVFVIGAVASLLFNMLYHTKRFSIEKATL